MADIMIVEDDEVTATHLKFSLQKLGYKVVAIAEDTLQARNKAKIYQPDLVLLDISLNEAEDGIVFARFLNDVCHIPFIYLSSHTEEAFIQNASYTKPYGYIVKPFEANTLHTTIQMALAQFKMHQEQLQTIENLHEKNRELEKIEAISGSGDIVSLHNAYRFDMKRKELYQGEALIKLTKNEKLCLYLLILNRDHVVSFEQLEQYIWEDGSATENSVRTLVWRLRSKLEHELIENVSGQGYKLASS